MPSRAAAGVPAAPGCRAEEPRRPWLLHVWLLDAEAAAAAAARSSSGGRMLGQQQQQLYSSAALLTGERSRLLTCYVQDYLECVESLPHDMQRNVSVLRELDNKYQGRGRGAAGKVLPHSGPLAAGHGRSEPVRGSATFLFSCDSLPDCTEGVWCVGRGNGTGDRVRGPPFPRCGRRGLLGGSQGWGWWPLVSRRCRPSGCSWCGDESAILSSKHLFRPSPARCRRPSCLGRGACSWAGAVGSERPAAAGLPLASGAWLSPPPPSGPHPLRADALERAGGRGRERAAKAASGEVPPSALRLPAWE